MCVVEEARTDTTELLSCFWKYEKEKKARKTTRREKTSGVLCAAHGGSFWRWRRPDALAVGAGSSTLWWGSLMILPMVLSGAE